jgi:uncharacterized Zn-binding protein involved in type VI secretion
MSVKPAARKGDPTADGDSNLIDSGSDNVLFDGLPAAREGDTTECGSELCDKVSSTVLINGKAAVMVDSEGTVGNAVMSGSGTVLIGDTYAPTKMLRDSALSNRDKAPNRLADTTDGNASTNHLPIGSVLDYTISLRLDGNRTLTPLEVPDFKNLPPKPTRSSERIEFSIRNRKFAADVITLEIFADNEIIYTETETTAFLQPGEHDWYWDGYNDAGVLDTGLLKQCTLKVCLTAKKGDQQRTFETLIIFKAKVDWLDAKINRGLSMGENFKITANITLRPSFTDGGATGPSSSVSTPYEVLLAWAKEGIEHYWSRNSTRNQDIAYSVSTPKGTCLIAVHADINVSPAAPNFKLIDNLSNDAKRSTSLGGFRKIYHNLGPRLKSPFNPKHYASQEFKETAAHEFGHLILNEYGGTTNYSWLHKGTSNLAQQAKPKNPTPRSGEIDLMHYFSDYNIYSDDRYDRTTASEQDVRSLLYLSRVDIEISKKGTNQW